LRGLRCDGKRPWSSEQLADEVFPEDGGARPWEALSLEACGWASVGGRQAEAAPRHETFRSAKTYLGMKPAVRGTPIDVSAASG
jgi:hypothetical protein